MEDAESTEYEDEQAPLLRRTLTRVSAPLNVLLSRPLIKAYISTVLFLLTSIALLTISTTSYLTFYYNYIPQINLERVIYLQYGSSPPLHAVTMLETSALITQQPYDVDIVLHMPRTPSNLAAGNFMLDLALIPAGVGVSSSVAGAITGLLQNNTSPVLQRSQRPAILPYSSPILNLSHTLLQLPWHLLSFRDLDANTLVVPMFELVEFERNGRNIPTSIRLEIQSDTNLQIYNAKVIFRARFLGLRYYVYNYRFTAFALFTTVFYSISVSSMAVAWFIVSSFISQPKHETSNTDQTKRIKQEPQEDIKQESIADGQIKTEASSSEHGPSLEMTEGQFPTLRGQMPLPYQDDHPHVDMDMPLSAILKDHPAEEAADDEDEDDDRGRMRTYDSGIGTSMESENAASIGVRRRASKQAFTPKTER